MKRRRKEHIESWLIVIAVASAVVTVGLFCLMELMKVKP